MGRHRGKAQRASLPLKIYHPQHPYLLTYFLCSLCLTVPISPSPQGRAAGAPPRQRWLARAGRGRAARATRVARGTAAALARAEHGHARTARDQNLQDRDETGPGRPGRGRVTERWRALAGRVEL